jgi:hypothetical protein
MEYPEALIMNTKPNKSYPGAFIVSVRCCFCGGLHRHGIPSIPDNRHYGIRLSHCNENPKEYQLTRFVLNHYTIDRDDTQRECL